MSSVDLYSKIKELFPHDVENINIQQFLCKSSSSSHDLSCFISQHLPHLSRDQLHLLCRNQEKQVLNKITEVRSIDLYQQIANVCPSQKDLRTLSMEEVDVRMNLYAKDMKEYSEVSDDEEDDLPLKSKPTGASDTDSNQMEDLPIDDQGHSYDSEQHHYHLKEIDYSEMMGDQNRGYRDLFQFNNKSIWADLHI